MEIEERNEINQEKSEQFKIECDRVNAEIYNVHWSWKNIGGNVGQITIKGENGDSVALWEEHRDQIQMLIDSWDFKKDEFMAIGITHHHRIIRVSDGVFGIAWMDDDYMFQMIFFDQQDDEFNATLPTEADTLDELKELDALMEDDY